MKLTDKQKHDAWIALIEVIEFVEGGSDGILKNGYRIPKETEKVLKDELFDFLEKYFDLNVEFTNDYSNYGEVRSATHNFYYSRNFHGTGFWDREEFYGKRAKELDRLAKTYEELILYTGHAGWLYAM